MRRGAACGAGMTAGSGTPAPATGWLQLMITVPRGAVDAVCEAMSATGASAATIEDGGDQPVFDTGQEHAVLWDTVRVTGLYPAHTPVDGTVIEIARRSALPATPPYDSQPVPDRDWERAWMGRFRPMRFGAGLWVVPSWHQPPDPQATNIVIDPGLAFGTGTHDTTAMCLEWLARHAPVGLDVIDYGCGSGILAIAAARLGAARVRAVDIDTRAVQVTADNAARNGVADVVQSGAPSLLDGGRGADLVMANILARPLIDLAARITAAVRPGGALLLTGINESQGGDVGRAYVPEFRFERVHRGDWLLLAGRRHA